ncbi:hypothetical protein T484DRAFT_1905787, partial [Baffinella frigidus]
MEESRDEAARMRRGKWGAAPVALVALFLLSFPSPPGAVSSPSSDPGECAQGGCARGDVDSETRLGALDSADTRFGAVHFERGDCPCGLALKTYGEALPDLRALLGMVVSNGSKVVVAGGGCGWVPLVLSELVGERGEVLAAVPPLDLLGLLAGSETMLKGPTRFLLAVDYDAQAVVLEPATASALVVLRRRFKRTLYLHIGAHSRGNNTLPGDPLRMAPPPIHVLAGPPGGGMRGEGFDAREEGVQAIQRVGG